MKMTFPKKEGGKFCRKSIGKETAGVTATVSYDNSTCSWIVISQNPFKCSVHKPLGQWPSVTDMISDCLNTETCQHFNTVKHEYVTLDT